MPDNNTLLIDVLRAAGHINAAELASKVLAHTEPAEEKPDPASPPPRRVTAEDHDRAAGQLILDKMNAQINRAPHASVPLLDGRKP